jgi:hypothetical protein
MASIQQKMDEQSVPAKPFARLTLGSEKFLIGEPESADGLMFRVEAPEAANDSWAPLTSRSEDGWSEVAAEIVRSRDGALARFLATHAVRVWGEFDKADEEIDFDIDGRSIRLRRTPSGGELMIDEADVWYEVELEGRPSDDYSRAATIAVLEAAFSSGLLHLPEFVGWSRRLAMGAQVMPVL